MGTPGWCAKAINISLQPRYKTAAAFAEAQLSVLQGVSPQNRLPRVALA